jgi:nitronate monooxygenase
MLHTPLCDLLGIDHPIIGAPMAGTATAPLAAAISAAGGFGMIGGSDSENNPDHADWLRAEIRALRERSARPFGVGFILSFPDAAALTDLALAEGVAAIAYSFGDAAPLIERVHAAGARALVQVQTVGQARAAAAAGADVIAAQGSEGGGHTGQIGTLSLVPAVVDALPGTPVVAAGGIADGRGLAAALMLGAAGVWLGTRFVASAEWAGGDWRKDRVVAASTDDTIWTRAYDLGWGLPFPDGIAGRVLRNDFTAAWHDRDDAILAEQQRIRAMLETADEAGDPALAPVWAGSTAGLIHAVEPAAAIVRRVAADAERLLREGPPALTR